MVDLVNDQNPTVRRHYREAVSGEVSMVTCALAAHEFIYGAMISGRPQVHVPNAERLLAGLQIVPWTHDDGVAAARLRHSLRRAGRTIGMTDALIAGQALARGWTMVSANLHEFERVEGLRTIDWTAPAATP